MSSSSDKRAMAETENDSGGGLEADIKARIPMKMKEEFREILRQKKKKDAAVKLSDLYREAFTQYLSKQRKVVR